MFRCPKCHTELPADARFCNKCGFNHTNAMKAVSPAQAGSGPKGAIQPPPGTPGGQGLTKRYAGNQPPQQGPMPSGVPPVQQPPMPPQGSPAGQIRQSEQVVRTSTPPPPKTLLGGRGPQGPVPITP